MILMMFILCSCRYLPPIRLPSGISKLPGGGFQEICWEMHPKIILALKNPIPPSFENDIVRISVEDGQIKETTVMSRDFSLPNCSTQGSNAVLTVDVNEIWFMDLDNTKLSFFSKGEGAVFSHDGNEIVIFVSNLSNPDSKQREIQVFDFQGKIQRSVDLKFENDISIDGTQYLSGLSLSPDGKSLIISLIDYDAEIIQNKIYIADTNSGEITNLFPEDQAGYAHWSPDGNRLAYINVIDDVLSEGELVIADREGNCLYKPDIPAEVDGLTWSQDSNRIAFLLRGAVFILDVESLSTSEEAMERCQ
jgi:Tol biopolymer transport system component